MFETRQQPVRLSRDIGTVTDIGTAEMIAAITGGTIQVWRIQITSGAAQDLIIKSATTVLGTYYNVTSIVLDYNFHPWFETASGEALNLTTETADDVSWIIDYTDGRKVSSGAGVVV